MRQIKLDIIKNSNNNIKKNHINCHKFQRRKKKDTRKDATKKLCKYVIKNLEFHPFFFFGLSLLPFLSVVQATAQLIDF